MRLDPTASQKTEIIGPNLRRALSFSIAAGDTTPQHTMSSQKPAVDLLDPSTLARALKSRAATEQAHPLAAARRDVGDDRRSVRTSGNRRHDARYFALVDTAAFGDGE